MADSGTTEENNSLNKETESIGTIEVNEIFTAMHKKAADEATKAVKNYKVVNSAVDDQGKFQGAGQLIIMATPTSEEIVKEDALKAILTYVNWFCGPDVAKELNIDKLIPVTLPLSEEDKKKAGKKQADDKETAKEKEKAEESLQVKTFLLKLFESTFEEDQEIAKENDEKVTGYYIQYEAEIGNMKQSTVDSAWQRLKKQLGDILKGLGVLGFSWKTGAKGKEHMLGGLMGKKDIDPAKLVSNVLNEIKAEYPNMQPTVTVIDTKSIANHLKERLTKAAKSLLNTAKFALCIKVNKNDKNYELIAKQDIADFTTKATSIDNKKPIVKISKDLVILVNNYSDEKKDKNDNQFKKQEVKKTEISKESIEDIYNISKLLFEDLSKNEISNIFEKDVDPEVAEAVDKILKIFNESPNKKEKLKSTTEDLTAGEKHTGKSVKGGYNKGDAWTNELVLSKITTKPNLQTLPKPILDKILEVLNNIEDSADDKGSDEETEDSEEPKNTEIAHIEELMQEIANKENPKIDSKLTSYKDLKKALRDADVYSKDFNEIISKIKSVKDKDKDKLKPIINSLEDYKEEYDEKHKDTSIELKKELKEFLKKYAKKEKALQNVLDNTKDKNVRKFVLKLLDKKLTVKSVDDIEDAKEISQYIEEFKKVEDEVGSSKDSDEETKRVRGDAIIAKFHYIKYNIPALIEKGYYKPKYQLKFDMPTNENKLIEIEKLPYDASLKELLKHFDISDEEIEQFKGKSNKELKEMVAETNKTAGSPLQKAIIKLHEELLQLVQDPSTGKIRDLKTLESIVPSFKTVSIDAIRDNDSNWWDLSVGAILRHMDKIKEWAKTADDNVSKEITSKKTDADFYIIPIKNIKSEAQKQNLRPDNNNK